MTSTIVLAIALSVGASDGECPAISHPQAVDAVRQFPVSELEEGLPDQPLAEWLAAWAGDRTVCWEANDCGEQTGDPAIDHARDLPLCVAWTLDAAGLAYEVLVVAGTWNRGVHGPPLLRAVSRRDGGEMSAVESLAALADLLAK